MGGSIGQCRFICQVLCSGMQVISTLVLGGSVANVGSSVEFCVVVCKSSLFWYWGVIGQHRFICQVWCSSIPDIYAHFPGGPSAKVCSSAKFSVLVCKANITCQSWNLLLSFGGYFRGFGGCWGVTSDMSVQCWLTVYYPNYSEITGNSHLFWKNPKWLPNLSHNIYPMMHLGGQICQICQDQL